MKLPFKLNGNTFECSIGYSLLNAASTKIKADRLASFRANLEIIASQGPNANSNDSIKRVLEEHIYTQIPSDDEVKQWLGTLDGKRFSLVYGTRNQPIKLNEETVDSVLDEMSEDEHSKLSYAVETLCFGSVIADLTRQSTDEMLGRAKAELEKAKAKTAEISEPKEAALVDDPPTQTC